MWNIPTKKRLDRIPKLYATDMIHASDKRIFLHFFILGCDWYVAEYDGDDLFFGFAILNEDHINSEWGFFSFSELKEIRVGHLEINCELEKYWKIRKASEIEKIKV